MTVGMNRCIYVGRGGLQVTSFLLAMYSKDKSHGAGECFINPRHVGAIFEGSRGMPGVAKRVIQ
jgi:hypothetical protein